MYKHELQVAWEDEVSGFYTSAAWQNLCAHARVRAMQQQLPVLETLTLVLAELEIHNPASDNNIYFKSAEDRLMFILRWS